MNFSQIHERLRLELVRRIDRGVLTGSLLALQSGFGQAHISNFLRKRRILSLKGLDRILQSQFLTISDLLPDQYLPSHQAALAQTDYDAVPLVSASAALHSQNIAPAAVLELLRIPQGILKSFHPRRAQSRKDWLRFVAIRVTSAQASAMEPILTPDSIAVIDRQYNSLQRYNPARPTLYAVQYDNTLLIRYLDFEAGRLVLRTHSPTHPVLLLEVGENHTPADYVTGRICYLLSHV